MTVLDIMNIDTAKSYATEANLEKALERFGFAAYRHVAVRNREGRWTAIFPLSEITGKGGCGYLGLFASKGFKTIG
jgi:hypothetical protein